MVPHPAQALGTVEGAPGLSCRREKVNKIALYKEAATQVKVPLPKSEMRTSKLIDGTVWNGKDPAQYADSFKIKA